MNSHQKHDVHLRKYLNNHKSSSIQNEVTSEKISASRSQTTNTKTNPNKSNADLNLSHKSVGANLTGQMYTREKTNVETLKTKSKSVSFSGKLAMHAGNRGSVPITKQSVPVKLCLENLPDEMLLNIMTYLSPTDILSMSCVNSRWFSLANDNSLWHEMYLKFITSKNHKQTFNAKVNNEPYFWKQKFLSACLKMNSSKVDLTKLKKIDRFTGLPSATEKTIRSISARWVLSIVGRDGKEIQHNFHNDLFYFSMAMSVRWYNMQMPQVSEMKEVRIYAARPIIFDKGKVSPNSPCQRILVQSTELHWNKWVSDHSPVVEDESISVYSIPPGLILAFWKNGDGLAFFTASFHYHGLVKRCIMGTSTSAYVCPVVKIPRDDIDSEYGLHGYSCTIELRNQRKSFWSQQWSGLHCRKQDIGGGHARFQLIDPSISYQRSSFTEKIVMPWKTELFTGKIFNFCFMDCTLLDENGNPMWCFSEAELLKKEDAGNTRYDYDGSDLMKLEHLDADRGRLSVICIWEESTGQYFVIDAWLDLSIGFINHWFHTHY